MNSPFKVYVHNKEDEYFMSILLFPYPVNSFTLETGPNYESQTADIVIEQVDTIHVETNHRACRSTIG